MYTLAVQSKSKSKAACTAMRVRELTRRLTAMVAAGFTELQGVTVDFWGGPQLQLWPQAARPFPGPSSPDVPLLPLRCTESHWAARRGL